MGFVCGLALEVLVSQLAKMLGVINPWSLLISAPAVALLLVGRRIALARSPLGSWFGFTVGGTLLWAVSRGAPSASSRPRPL